MKGNPMAMTHRPLRPATVFMAAALLLVACGGESAAEDGAAVSARPPQEQTTITQADVATPVELQAGRYRFGWDAPECKGVDFALTGTTQGFVYSKKSALPKFQSIVSDVPADTYTLSQSDTRCTAWTVLLDRIGS
jgi:hypothetical protein